MKAGAYVYVIVDERTGKLAKIVYVGHGENLRESLRFLNLVHYKLDADHEEVVCGDRKEGKHSIAHHAEGVLIEENKSQVKGPGGLFQAFFQTH